MNHNLTAVALTIFALGIIAAFEIIPGAGLYAGITMLLVGAVALLSQLVGPYSAFFPSLKSRPVPAA